MSTMSDTLAAAKAAAQTAVVANAGATQDYAPPANYAPTKMPSLRESADTSGLTVDTYLGITADGIKVSGDGDLVKELVLSIDFAEVVPTMNIRGEIGGQVTYARTSDGVRTVEGKSWADELARITRQSDPSKLTEYKSVEIPFTLITKNGKFEAGTTVGYTPAPQAAREFLAFFKKTPEGIEDAGPQTIKLTHMKKVGSGNKYGIVSYTLMPN